MRILGIDPGVKNTGFVLVDWSNSTPTVLQTSVKPLTKELVVSLADLTPAPDRVVIEKFVVYRGRGVDVEEVARRIGWLEFAFWQRGVEPTLVRAVEWQTGVLAELGRLPKAGKRFQLKARKLVEELFGLKFKTEHEADAFLMTYWAKLKLCS
jgi:Holliday junction resolvasome RuvABC endonuclease subunit